MQHNGEILIFARYPVAGKAKTRLIPALGAENAAQMHKRMTENIVGAARTNASLNDRKTTICFTGGKRKDFKAWLGNDLNYVKQIKGGLGERLKRGFQYAFRHGAKAVIAVGCDVPELTPVIFNNAFEALNHNDVVLGPAEDGGYYLIGLKEPASQLFNDIDWGTDRVADQTLNAAESCNYKPAKTPVLSDIDRPGDLGKIRDDSRFADILTSRISLSVVIPTLNEAAVLEQTLARLRNGQAEEQAEGTEIIIADGGSTDGTKKIAQKNNINLIEIKSGGRAAQLNAGADATAGHHLLFLHADTLVPDNYAHLISSTLKDPAITAGAFRFKTDLSGFSMRCIELLTLLRCHLFHMPYGDQGLFLERRVFNEIGRFAQLPVMEDYELVRRLSRRGKVRTIPEAAMTSGRRWAKLGVWRGSLHNQFMLLGYNLGVSPSRLAQFYSDQQNRDRHRDSQ